jgi:hypothetical protein
MKVFIAADRRLQTVQFLLKLPGLSGLKEARVEQDEAHVAEHKDANGKKEIPAPTDKRIISRQKSYSPLNSDIHGIALAAGND